MIPTDLTKQPGRLRMDITMIVFFSVLSLHNVKKFIAGRFSTLGNPRD